MKTRYFREKCKRKKLIQVKKFKKYTFTPRYLDIMKNCGVGRVKLLDI